MDLATRTRVTGIGLFTTAAGLAAMMVFWLVADVSLVPPKPLHPSPRPAMALQASGWITVGGLDTNAGTVRSVAQAVPPPVAPVELDQAVLYVQAGSGPPSSRLMVDVYETSYEGATGPGRLMSSASAAVDGPHPGLIYLFFDPPVRASPGHWYTFVLRTSEPGSGLMLGLVTGGIGNRSSLWATDAHAGVRPSPGHASWAQISGFKLLLLMQH